MTTMITSQEISNFVNQPTPRKIPKNVLRAVDDKFSRYLAGLFILIFSALTLFVLYAGKFILLDIGSNKTVQGVLIGWRLYEVQEFNISCYHLVVRYPAPKGELTADCYVDFRENIPGWGKIPESLSYQDSDDFIHLSTPFPVIVEYVSIFPTVGRAVGTRGTPDADALSEFWVVLYSCFWLMLTPFVVRWYFFRKKKQLLVKGYFTTGLISEPKTDDEDTAKSLKNKFIAFMKFMLTPVALFIKPIDEMGYKIALVWFNDQHGKKQTGMCKVRTKRDKEKCRQLFKSDRPVGILYLPDSLEIFITDLWLND